MSEKISSIVAELKSCTPAELAEIHRQLEPWYFEQSRRPQGGELGMAYSFVGSFTRMIANTFKKALPA